MKKLYSKKLGGEAFALDAAQLDTCLLYTSDAADE